MVILPHKFHICHSRERDILTNAVGECERVFMQKFRTMPIVFLAIAAALMLVGLPLSAQPDASQIALVEIASGFTRPLFVTHAGDGSGRLFVVEQGGRIWVLRDGMRLQTPFLDISELVSREALSPIGFTERGLLGLAFDPDYARNGRFYINYTDRSGTSVIARYRVSANNPDLADPDSAQILLIVPQPFANHNGGHLEFGPDGYLYVSLGDGGSGGDPQNHGQNLGTLLGTILRIDVSGDGDYAIPDDNPFIDQPGAMPEIWAYGLRNAWRFSFDAATGDLYIADVGQNLWEEINFQPADSPGGENYGWNWFEGSAVYRGGGDPSAVVMPVAEYTRNEGISVTGGYVYRGTQIPALVGYYVYGDFGSGNIWTLRRDDAGVWQSHLLMRAQGRAISSFGLDEAGELYLVDYGGTVLKFVPAS
jgi:glucose/arabinose dehydrogenase